MVIHGRLDTRVETRCLGWIGIYCLASRFRHFSYSKIAFLSALDDSLWRGFFVDTKFSNLVKPWPWPFDLHTLTFESFGDTKVKDHVILTFIRKLKGTIPDLQMHKGVYCHRSKADAFYVFVTFVPFAYGVGRVRLAKQETQTLPRHCDLFVFISDIAQMNSLNIFYFKWSWKRIGVKFYIYIIWCSILSSFKWMITPIEFARSQNYENE